MANLPCVGYAKAKIEECAERRDNGYWTWDDWADEWCYKCPKWQPGKFFCITPILAVKVAFKLYHFVAHKVCVLWKTAGFLLCVFYVGSISVPLWFGKIFGFNILTNTGPTSAFGPAIAYGRQRILPGQEASTPLIMCWTEPADPRFGASGLRLKYEQLHHYTAPFHNVLPQFNTKAVDGEVSHRGPALTYFDDRFFLAWTGKDKEHRLHVMQSCDGGDTWSNKVILKVSSTSAPGLAVFKNRIYLAWRGEPRQGSYLNIMSSADGLVWENETKFGGRAETGPALARLGSLLFIAWSGKDDHQLYVRSSKDGVLFQNEVTLQETTDARPALCGCGGYLYLTWKEKGGAGVIKMMRSRNGFEWARVLGSPLPASPLDTGKPALASADNGLIIGWADPTLHIAGKTY